MNFPFIYWFFRKTRPMSLKKFLLYAILFSFHEFALAFSLSDLFIWSNNIQQEPDFVSPTTVVDDATLISIPFEELSSEDKFLQEAQKFTLTISTSSLDTCEHRAVLKIQTLCNDMTEETLAKLSIGLLNCQSEVSGRTQVVCTDKMSLKECTSQMDSETWNAYHIINNRARAVCYVKHQEQFRALSEMTVNKLMSSALNHVATMDTFKELQNELNVLTANMMSSLKKEQQVLVDQNGGMQVAQKKMRDGIAANLKHLAQEKTLIHNSQNNLRILYEKLSHELDHMGSQLDSQSKQHLNIHQEILTNLANIAVRTDSLWNTIDEKTQQLIQQQDKIQKITAETLQKLGHINSTINSLLNLVNLVKAEVDSKIAWAHDTVGDGPILLAVMQHTIYLVTGVLVSLFLQLPLVCRLLLLLCVLSNIALVYHYQDFDLMTLTVIIIGLWAGTVLIPIFWHVFKKIRVIFSKRNPNALVETEDDKISTSSSSRSAASVSLNRENFHDNSIFGEHDDNFLSTDINSNLSYLKHRTSTSRNESRKQPVCSALCRNGQLCRCTPILGHKFCRRHITH